MCWAVEFVPATRPTKKCGLCFPMSRPGMGLMLPADVQCVCVCVCLCADGSVSPPYSIVQFENIVFECFGPGLCWRPMGLRGIGAAAENGFSTSIAQLML